MIPLLPVAAGAVQAATGAVASATHVAANAATAGADFSAAMGQAASDAARTLRSAETVSMAGLEGKASVQQVVDGVMSAERTLQTALAVRDKAVSAWQQISQMPI
jgi:flagellar hook-basal body complex protein FliE